MAFLLSKTSLRRRANLKPPQVSIFLTMQKLGIPNRIPLSSFVKRINVLSENENLVRNDINSNSLKAVSVQFRTRTAIEIQSSRLSTIKSVSNEGVEELSDEDDEVCPVECVREFKTDEEFLEILDKAKETSALVVVDFYRTSCGSCKYIEQGFVKLCKGSGDQDAPVIFLKHNVVDEYDEQSEVADRLRIKTVPLFHFYKNGVLLEAFPTRDKGRILEAILKYTAPASQEVESGL